MPRRQDRLVLDRLPLGKNVADRRGVGGQVVGHEAIDLIWIDAARRPDVTPLFGVRRIEIGRASWRESVCQYVLISVVAASLKNKKPHQSEQYQCYRCIWTIIIT